MFIELYERWTLGKVAGGDIYALKIIYCSCFHPDVKKLQKTVYTKGALNARINVCTIVSLKMLSIIEIDNKFVLNQSKNDKAKS